MSYICHQKASECPKANNLHWEIRCVLIASANFLYCHCVANLIQYQVCFPKLDLIFWHHHIHRWKCNLHSTVDNVLSLCTIELVWYIWLLSLVAFQLFILSVLILFFPLTAWLCIRSSDCFPFIVSLSILNFILLAVYMLHFFILLPELF